MSIRIVIVTLVLGFSFSSVSAQSQCSGLSNSVCGKNSTCTWRKSSVDKNGKKTKAHCRALPGKAKKSLKTKASNNKAKAKEKTSKVSSKNTDSVKSKTSAVKSKTSKSKVKAKAKSSTNKSKAKAKVKKAAKSKAKKDS